MIAARIIVERLCPPRKDRPISFKLPKIENASDASRAMAGILSSVASGEITPQEASEVATLIEGFVDAPK